MQLINNIFGCVVKPIKVHCPLKRQASNFLNNYLHYFFKLKQIKNCLILKKIVVELFKIYLIIRSVKRN